MLPEFYGDLAAARFACDRGCITAYRPVFSSCLPPWPSTPVAADSGTRPDEDCAALTW